jgi:hypothetical protein
MDWKTLPTLMPPLTKKQASEFKRLPVEEQRLYLYDRLHDEADYWLEYFMRHPGQAAESLRKTLLLRPPQC